MTNPMPSSGGSYVRLPDGSLQTAEDASKAPDTAPTPVPAPAPKAAQKPPVKEA